MREIHLKWGQNVSVKVRMTFGPQLLPGAASASRIVAADAHKVAVLVVCRRPVTAASLLSMLLYDLSLADFSTYGSWRRGVENPAREAADARLLHTSRRPLAASPPGRAEFSSTQQAALEEFMRCSRHAQIRTPGAARRLPVATALSSPPARDGPSSQGLRSQPRRVRPSASPSSTASV